MASLARLDEVTAPCGKPRVFLFLGGFLLAAAVERWGLHRRIAHAVVALAGTGPQALVLGFMTASALLSMWISNSAAMLLLTVATSLIAIAGSGTGHRLASAQLPGVAMKPASAAWAR